MEYNITGEIKKQTGINGSVKNLENISGDLNVSGFGGGETNYIIGDGLKVTGNVLSVDTTNLVEKDNTKPITSSAVFTTVGNIEIILGTI